MTVQEVLNDELQIEFDIVADFADLTIKKDSLDRCIEKSISIVTYISGLTK